MAIDEHDMHVVHCRMLGHEVNFAYCRKGGYRATGVDNLPCHKVLDCWFDKFAIAEFLRKNYTDGQIRQIMTSPDPKLVTLVNLVQKAKQDDSQPKTS